MERYSEVSDQPDQTEILTGVDVILGEHASLQALHAVVPTICPLSLGFGKLSASSSYFLLTEFLDVNAQTSEMGSGLSFAQKLATLHSAPVAPPEGHNQAIFVFPVTTYAGCTMQDNTFRRSWAKFYAENRLRTISRLIEQAHGTDDELRTWIERTAAEIVPKLLRSSHLGGKRGVSPVLVHGDLWSGNKARASLEVEVESRTLYSTRAVVMHTPSTNLD
jgi:protein-ribulosamine 3-kinase